MERKIKKFEKAVGTKGDYFILEIGWTNETFCYWIMKGDPNNVKDATYITQFKSLEEAQDYLKNPKGE